MDIILGARASPLSRAQVDEVLTALRPTWPQLSVSIRWVETRGDRDLTTSLRTMERTDFFTRELDEMVQKGEIQAAIHSAKDLPNPLPRGLVIAAMTQGIDSRDALVLRAGETVRPRMRVATSSARREEAVRALCPDAEFLDLRGTIGARLSLLERGDADGVVIAEAALIRLRWTHWNRVYLPGETALHQGRLAVIARAGDRETIRYFQCIHVPS